MVWEDFCWCVVLCFSECLRIELGLVQCFWLKSGFEWDVVVVGEGNMFFFGEVKWL